MKVVFTVITNNYDTLKEPVVSEGWQYVCFADRFMESDVWECIVTTREQRFIKIKYYRELLGRKRKGVSLYIDGSFEIIGDLNEFIKEAPTWFSMRKHPGRDCTFKEAKAVISLKGMSPVLVEQQMERYKDLPKNWGLAETGIMLRGLADRKVKSVCDLWWTEYKKGVPRDQLSVMIAFYRLGMRPYLIPNEVVCKYFKEHKHNK